MTEHQPVLATDIWLAGGRRFVSRSVRKPEELPVELGERARVDTVQHDLPKPGERRLIIHDVAY